MKKRWADNIREWTGLDLAKSQKAGEDRDVEKAGGIIFKCTLTAFVEVKG